MAEKSTWKVQTNRFVAFLDILGFKDYVLHHNLNDVYDRLLTLNDIQPDDGSEDDFSPEYGGKIYFTAFSDSIFIFTKNDDVSNFKYLIKSVSRMIRQALRKGIPLKGAIAYGDIVVDISKSIFCGQPITDAYLLEEDLQYMGIVFHHSVENYLREMLNDSARFHDTFFREINTPFKYGYRVHYNLNYLRSLNHFFRMDNHVIMQRFESSGDARKYVDNTLSVIESLKELAER